MMRRIRNTTLTHGALLLAGALAGLTGCAFSTEPTPIRADLAAEPREIDALPASVEAPEIVAGSSRHLGSESGVDYYLTTAVIEPRGTAGICIVLFNTAEERGVTGCGAEGSSMEGGGSGVGTYRVLDYGADKTVEDGWVELTEFLLVDPPG